ncbi:hypothetical protein M2164_005927 [Streptomyces sp. SAI-208]|uniref:hypothetical protein n=1 Tax=Streptomyces sp. SAI-208 TaxID=2940550 RepID=UPI002476874C|nr:hypothetical protein [Streptomyces sp. SAI-208]MDH6610292.1 hypothetical protein [Streptomyces sp. SAI-208]
MEIVSYDKDGNVTVKMSAAEAREVISDLDWIPFSMVSPSGAKLCNLLEALHGKGSQ